MNKLDIHVGGSFADSRQRLLDAIARAERGETVHADHLTFESWEALAAVMTPKRMALIRHLHRTPEASIAALARNLNRDYKRVHEDVEALTAAGLITRDDGLLMAGYDEITARIAV
jgi:predicted transcriptional regulator